MRDRVASSAAERASYGSFVSFEDPDGDGWLFLLISTRRPGR
jgi:hypothetical protein